MVQTAAQKKAEDARTAQAKRNAELTPREFQETHERGAHSGHRSCSDECSSVFAPVFSCHMQHKDLLHTQRPLAWSQAFTEAQISFHFRFTSQSGFQVSVLSECDDALQVRRDVRKHHKH